MSTAPPPAEVITSGFFRIDAGVAQVFDELTSDEYATLDSPKAHARGAAQERDRIARIADLCASRSDGDLIEIGCNRGLTSVRLAEVAARHGRRLIAVDPWIMAGQYWWEGAYEDFCRVIAPHAEIVDVIRASSMESHVIDEIRARPLCFAFVDGLHTHAGCLSDILTTSHTSGVICVDDVRWSEEVSEAFREGAARIERSAIHHPLCREGYLLPPA